MKIILIIDIMKTAIKLSSNSILNAWSISNSTGGAAEHGGGGRHGYGGYHPATITRQLSMISLRDGTFIGMSATEAVTAGGDAGPE
jgi:hypothetical protein